MSFREKTAWGMGLILILAGAWYFRRVADQSAGLGYTSPPDMGFVIGYVILVVIASITVTIILGTLSGREAEAPADEREKTILDRAGHWSGYVLAVGVLGALWQFGTNGDGNLMFHLAFGALMLSQIAEYALQIVLYRRGV